MGRHIVAPNPPVHRVCLMQTGEAFDCRPVETLLQGMLRLGRKGIPAGCINGGCGICKVRVREGRCEPAGAISRAHVSVEEERDGITLACRAVPCGEVKVEVIGRMQRGFLNPFGGASVPGASTDRR